MWAGVTQATRLPGLMEPERRGGCARGRRSSVRADRGQAWCEPEAGWVGADLRRESGAARGFPQGGAEVWRQGSRCG